MRSVWFVGSLSLDLVDSLDLKVLVVLVILVSLGDSGVSFDLLSFRLLKVCFQAYPPGDVFLVFFR